ncbi:MAG: Wzz/FepE/Etk N-terminal domain-containing protein [Planctomycetales bacterium]|nr:Wzz/FepE/Etk N-terminal domain-containing protein [Planctomycetales bacterium]
MSGLGSPPPFPEDPNVVRFVAGGAPAEPEADPFAYARVVWRRRKLVGVAVGGTVLLTAVVNLLLPRKWEATAALMPASASNPLLPQSLAGRLPVAAIPTGLRGLEQLDRLVTILESRTVAEMVIESCDLLPLLFPDRWDEGAKGWRGDPPDHREASRRVREGVLSVSTTSRGLVRVAAEWRDPETAARIANAAVAALERYLAERDVTVASRHRRFIEERREETRRDLARVEEELKAFSKEQGVVSVSEQTRALFEAIGRLMAEIQIEKARRHALSESRGTEDPEVRQMDARIRALEASLTELERGAPASPPAAGTRPEPNGVIPLYDVPEKMLEYQRRLRSVTILGEVFLLLSKELESAKIEEKREQVAITVLDPAQPPERPSRPRRTLNVILSAIVSAFGAVLLAFGADAWERSLAAAGAAPPPAPPAA